MSQVVQNQHLNGDRRNQSLVGMSDGIPMFRGKYSRSCVPIALRNANLPDSLGYKFRHMHLSALYPSEFWTVNKLNEQWERVDRKPTTLIPLLYALADDLLHWEDGEFIEDNNLPREHPDRVFKLRAILLYWCGDYPGLAEVTGFKHGTPNNGMCHWCEIGVDHDKETRSRAYGGFYRYVLCIIPTYA